MITKNSGRPSPHRRAVPLRRLLIGITEADDARLLEIAAEMGAVAPSGPMKGQPSRRRLVAMIASGEVLLARKDTRQD